MTPPARPPDAHPATFPRAVDPPSDKTGQPGARAALAIRHPTPCAELPTVSISETTTPPTQQN